MKSDEKVITVKNLVKKFGNLLLMIIFHSMFFEVEIFGFLGANGAGKTTAIKIYADFSSPTSGELNVAGLMFIPKPRRLEKL